MSDSTLREKPAKPYDGFPLFAHATGRWAKKIRGKLCYFGKWTDDPKGEAALQLYLDQRDDLHAGRTPRPKRDGFTVADLVNRFLSVKEQQRDAGDIKPRSFADYYSTCEILVAAFGRNRLVDDLAADDFEALRAKLSTTRNPRTLGNEVQRIRTVCKYAYDAGLIDRPVRTGPTFKRPAKRILRALRQKQGPRVFEARDLRRIIYAADQPLRAMILLGVNCGFGNSDCGTLPMRSVDLDGGWIDYPRPKTAVERRCPLWPETVEAIKAAIAERSDPKSPEYKGLLFITKFGGPWAKSVTDSPVSKEFRKLVDRLKIYRPGLTFYALRHTFETIGGDSRDQVAVNAIMGHADQTMAGNYRHGIDDGRLRAVADHVRNWLFPSPTVG